MHLWLEHHTQREAVDKNALVRPELLYPYVKLGENVTKDDYVASRMYVLNCKVSDSGHVLLHQQVVLGILVFSDTTLVVRRVREK